MNVAPADAAIYDATLKIEAKGVALSGSYVSGYGHPSSQKGTRLYPGAYLKGSISLEMEGVSSHKTAFKGVRETPFTLPGFAYRSPSKAPFRLVFDMSGSYKSKLFELLGHIYGAECIIAATKDEDVVVRKNATYALGRIGDPRTVEPLIARLNDEDKYVRKNAVYALGRIGDPRAVEPLTDCLKDEDGLVRTAATKVLGRIGDPRAVEPLIDCLKVEEAKDPRLYAYKPGWNQRKALEKITGYQLGSSTRWYRWWEDNKDRYLTTP